MAYFAKGTPFLVSPSLITLLTVRARSLPAEQQFKDNSLLSRLNFLGVLEHSSGSYKVLEAVWPPKCADGFCFG